MWEHSLIRTMCERPYYQQYAATVKSISDGLSDSTKDVLNSIRRYFKDNPSVSYVELQGILPHIKTIQSKDADDDGKKRLTLVCELLARVLTKQLSREEVADVKNQLASLQLAGSVQSALMQYNSGDLEDDLGTVLGEAVESYNAMADVDNAYLPVKKTVQQILKENDPDNGLSYPLEGLNRNLQNARPGDFIVIAAPNNVGKTALAMQFATHFGKQLPRGGKVLYLNNEGTGDHIVLRLRQIVLNKTIPELDALVEAGVDIEEEYQKKINGDENKIEVVDIHGCSIAHIKQIYKKYRPDVVIIDMLDAVSGFQDAAREDIKFKNLYGWFRAQAANPQHRLICVGTTQVSAEGFDFAYVPKHCLESSKTAKQSQTDVLIHINEDGKDENETIRYVWVPRAKRRRAGKGEGDSKFLASINTATGAYMDATKRGQQHDTDGE